MNLDVWDSRIKHLVWKVLQKPAFHICRDYVDFGVIFTILSMALGPILMIFGGLGAGLKHHDFQWFSGGSQTGGRPAIPSYLGHFVGPIPSSKQFPAAIQHAKYIMKHAGIKDTKKQDANYENTKNQGCNMPSLQQRKQEKDRADASQLGAPLRGAGGFFKCTVHAY